MASRRAGDGPDFTRTASLQFWALPASAIEAFAAAFVELTPYPERHSPTLDVFPIRNDPVRWRLKAVGYRAIYQIRPGRAVIEAILPRTEWTYEDFEAHRKRP